jgi:uncharacterized membrane protein
MAAFGNGGGVKRSWGADSRSRVQTLYFMAVKPGYLALICVLAVVALNAFALSAELRAGKFDVNDSVLHYTLADRMVQAVERGENPMDFWVSEWSLGYPVPRTYQILGHLSLVFLYFLLGKTVSVLTLFVWARYLLLVLLPLSVYFSGRLLMLPKPAAVASAAISPLIATNGLYGLEYGSFLWRGNGLFTQAFAMHLLLLTLGFGFRAVRGKSSPGLAGVLLGLTLLAHFILGFIGALSLIALIFLPNVLDVRKRLTRIAVIGLTSSAVSAFQLIPMILDGPLINHSRWEPTWKWNSFGASYVVKTLLQGGLLDHGRLPVLSTLALLGAAVCVFKMRESRRGKKAQEPDGPSATYGFVFAGALLWLLLFCGRPAWGVVFTVLGADNLQLHRLLAGFHAFAFFLIGIGLATLWTWLAQIKISYRYGIAGLVTLLILFPAVRERRFFLGQNAEWSRANLDALGAEEQDLKQAITSIGANSGRAYSGLPTTWGNQFRIGNVPFFATFSTHHVPSIGFLYHAMALTSDLMVWFDETNPAHYRLFNVTTVVAPDSKRVPTFLTRRLPTGRFQIYQAPGNGYFDIVQVPYAARTYPENFYDVSYAWLNSNWVLNLNHVLLDWNGKTAPELPRLGYGQPLPDAKEINTGFVTNQKRDAENYDASVQLQQPAYLLFKMTYHPNWIAVVDGRPQTPVMLTPGFMGVQLNAGEHTVQFRYQPGYVKLVLILAGAIVVLGLTVVERRGGLDGLDVVIDHALPRLKSLFDAQQVTAILTLAGLAALSLPVCVPLFTNQLISGHDAFSYVPRLVEFHENIRHGVLLPRWAPDLGNGAGQPLFIFNPPLLYYLAEIWYTLGFEATTAYNLTCITVVFASAVFMYLLGRLYFGRAGGWLASAAYIYAPYFHVNLFVRQAVAEFTAFPFYPLTLYGFARFARDRERRFLLLAAIGLAAIVLSHNAAALLFTPILIVFLVLVSWSGRSWRLLLHLAGGVVLGLGLSAFAWIPALLEMKLVHLERLLEGYLRYSNHFVYAHQFFFTNWGFGQSVAGAEDGMSFSLGWSHIVLVIVAIGLSLKSNRKEVRTIAGLFASVVVVCCLMMTPGAMWIWDTVRILQPIQFPWRMLGPVSACMAVASASVAGLSMKWNRGAGFVIALALLIAPNLNHIGAERYYRLSPSDWTPEQIARRGVTVGTREEYEPQSVVHRPTYEAERVRVIEGDARVSSLVTQPVFWAGQIIGTTDSLVRANLCDFPGWTITIDEKRIPHEVVPDSGEMQFRVPAGTHHLQLKFERTAARYYSEWISVLSLLILVWQFSLLTTETQRHREKRH